MPTYAGQDPSLPHGLVLLPGERAEYIFTEADRILGHGLVTAVLGGSPAPDGAVERLTALCQQYPQGSHQALWFLNAAGVETILEDTATTLDSNY